MACHREQSWGLCEAGLMRFAASAANSRHRIQFWRLRWQQYRTGMARAIAALRTTFRIVRDAEHRQLLYEALRSARFRLLIVSDQLSDRVVTRPFLKALNECLSRHVSVILIARRPRASRARYPEAGRGRERSSHGVGVWRAR